jgi:ATP-dependent 26S proteasome regulatory subunit
LILLARRFGLSLFERDLLLLCAAMELDTRIAGLCARAQDDPVRPYPTFALALSLFDEPSWDVVSSEGPLRYWRLIEINQTGGQGLTTSALRADERVLNYLKGLNYLDDRLAPLVAPLESTPDEVELAPSQLLLVEQIARLWRQSRGPMLPLIQLLGPDGPSKQLVAAQVASEVGSRLYRIPAELLSVAAPDIETLARLWQRESLLLPLVLYLDAHDGDGGEALARRLLTRTDGLLFLGSREPWSHLGRPTVDFDAGKPCASEQRNSWKSALGGEAAGSPAALAGQFNLNVATIHQIARTELAAGTGNLAERLWDACRASLRPRLDALAQRLNAKATWNDIVLPSEQTDLLRQIAAHVGRRSQVYEEWGFAGRMNRGLGISALFAGDSGTGKTMAAEVIANELRLNLYRIDLSAVVSKYIGETEKNLRRLFDAAEDGGAILFFDEADALFGKRSEVKDSHDRYANIEVNYLLQRIESFRGLAILATNVKSALDTAFIRRLRFVVTFPYPGTAERQRIWQGVFPRQTPKTSLDYDRLARLNLTGGNIHNAALNAAFLAADAGTRVSMPLVLAAARTEFLKMDRPVNEADFSWTEMAGVPG